MYKNYLEIKKSKNGNGVFTSVDLPAKQPILEISGNLVQRKDIIGRYFEEFAINLVQVGEDVFIDPSGNVGRYLNHSCNPNCYLHIVGNRAIIYSLYEIKANNELTFDYSLSSTDDKEDYLLQCNCGAGNCRKEISGFHLLSEKERESMIKEGVVPLFITQSSMFMKNPKV
jgi:hypothetical protein